MFFNADHFKERVQTVLRPGQSQAPVMFSVQCRIHSRPLDITGGETLEELRAELEEQGIVFAIAKPRGRFDAILKRTGVAEQDRTGAHIPCLRAGGGGLSARGGGWLGCLTTDHPNVLVFPPLLYTDALGVALLLHWFKPWFLPHWWPVRIAGSPD